MKTTVCFTDARTLMFYRMFERYGLPSTDAFAEAFTAALDVLGYPAEMAAIDDANNKGRAMFSRFGHNKNCKVRTKGLDDETLKGACIFYLASLSVHMSMDELKKLLDDADYEIEEYVYNFPGNRPSLYFRPFHELVDAYDDLLAGMKGVEPEPVEPITTTYRPSAVERSLYGYLGALVKKHGFEVVKEAVSLSKFDPDYSDMLAAGCFVYEQLESSAERILKSIKVHGVGEQVSDLETERRQFLDTLIIRNNIDTVDELLTGMTFDMVTHENVEELAADMLIDETEMLCFTLSAMIANINYK